MPSFSSHSHSICLARRRTKVILTTSAGPIWKGMKGNFSQARLPVLPLIPKGVRSRRMKTTLKASIHFHFRVMDSRSSMEKKIYTHTPSSSAADWMIIRRIRVSGSMYRVALKTRAMPYSVAALQRPRSIRSACWMKSMRVAFNRFSMIRSIVVEFLYLRYLTTNQKNCKRRKISFYTLFNLCYTELIFKRG